MGEIINLRKARKAKARSQQTISADANRAIHGRTLAERKRDRLEAEQAAAKLDGALISTPPPVEGEA